MQSFHPANPKNVLKLFEAEEKKKAEEQKKEELKRQYEQESARRHAQSLIKGADGPSEAPPSMDFMYQMPPGLAEAQNRKRKQDEEKTRAEKDAERFPVLANAPRQGEYTKDLEVTHKPFAVELRKTKCKRCGEWGHSLGDRECPLRNVPTTNDNDRKAMEDPLARTVGAEASGAALRWEAKAAPEARVHGGVDASDANQQFVPLLDEEEMAAMAAAAGAGADTARMEDLDPAVLEMLSEKQRRKLLKMYQKELKRSEHGSGGRTVHGERKRKKHRHKEKKEKHKSKKRRKRDEDSSAGSTSESD